MERDILAFACYICDGLIDLDAIYDDICEDCAGIIAASIAIETDREFGYIGVC